MPVPTSPYSAHEEAEALLPWYATGQLDPDDRALVEKHLSSCASCQRQLGLERLLADQIQSLAPEVDTSWARLRGRIENRGPARSRVGTAAAEIWGLLKRPAIATLAVAQLALLVLAGVLLPFLNQPQYQVLGAADSAAAPNVIVMFRPDATEADLRRAVKGSGASLVGGPTSADAYLLSVTAGARASALSRLRANPNVTMAEPIDGAAQ